MEVVIFGSTGRTCRRLVEKALDLEHEVTAFARDPAKLDISHEKLGVVRGDVTDAEQVDKAVAGQDAVLSALGHTRTSAKDVQEQGTRHIVEAMKRHGVRRIVSLTGAGVRDPREEPKLLDKAIVFLLKRFQRDVLEDAGRHAEVLRRSGLDWTIVRGSVLGDGDRTGEYRVGYVGKNSGTKISRADVADFMLKQLEDNFYLGQAPMVSY